MSTPLFILNILNFMLAYEKQKNVHDDHHFPCIWYNPVMSYSAFVHPLYIVKFK